MSALARSSLERAIWFMCAHLENFTADVAELVSIDSPTEWKPGVDEVGQLVRHRMERWGWEVTSYPSTTRGNCLSGTLRGRGTAKLLVSAHLDTVYPVGTVAAWPLTERDGVLIGPGVADLKGGVVSGLYTLRALQSQGFEDFSEFTLFLSSDEELGSVTSAIHYQDFARDYDAAFVLEPGYADRHLVAARKGGALYSLAVAGRSAHAGVAPGDGCNALLEMMHKGIALSRLDGFRRGVSVNLTVMCGGTKPNVIADLATAMVDVRVPEDGDLDLIDLEMERLRGECLVQGTSFSFSKEAVRPAMPRTAATGLLVHLAQENARLLGIDLVEPAEATGGTSDANFFAQMGLPVIDGLGPVGGHTHCLGEEYLDLTSVAPRAALLAGLLINTCTEVGRLRELRDGSGSRQAS